MQITVGVPQLTGEQNGAAPALLGVAQHAQEVQQSPSCGFHLVIVALQPIPCVNRVSP